VVAVATVKAVKSGWLTNPTRRARREQAFTLTDTDVEELINRIDLIERYAKTERRYERLLRMRDKALIAMAWTFFKRANEILRLKLKDVYWDDRYLYVTFRISKKGRRRKICPGCGHENGVRARRCSRCGYPLTDVEPVKTRRSEAVVTKRKTLGYPFCRYIVDWVKALKRLGADSDSWLFPRFNAREETFELKEGKMGLSVKRFNQILQRLDPTLTSHMFRYGAAEKLLRLGYTPFELAEIGDWSSSMMPETYARRKGLTPTLQRFGEDTRMV